MMSMTFYWCLSLELELIGMIRVNFEWISVSNSWKTKNLNCTAYWITNVLNNTLCCLPNENDICSFKLEANEESLSPYNAESCSMPIASGRVCNIWSSTSFSCDPPSSSWTSCSRRSTRWGVMFCGSSSIKLNSLSGMVCSWSV